MTKDSSLYLGHIYDCVLKIQQYTIGMSLEDFLANSQAQDAVERNFEIIGEATTKISVEFKSKHPELPWRKMKAMRNFLIHDYEEVDLNLIWETIQNRLPDLKTKLEKILN